MATGSINQSPLIVIVGPTASGKTALAIELAEQFHGEIICADSRTIYKGMDIGTAKPTKQEQARVPHWGLDLVEPGQHFSAADFKQYTEQKIQEIRGRGHIPFLVGGTGLYVDGVIFDYQFGPVADATRRAELERLSLKELHDYCAQNNVPLPENAQNKRYVMRAIERKSISDKRRMTPIDNTVIVGIATDKDTLRAHIGERTEHLFENGVVEEATILGKKYGWESEAMTGNIYRLVQQHLNGTLTLEQIKEKNTTIDWRLAKRQLTWLKRNPFILWETLPEAKQYLMQVLANDKKR